MSASSITMTATYADRQSLDALADLIGKRVKRLGETTAQAVTATAINVLKSIRARTKVATTDKPAGVTVARRNDLCVSYSMHGGKRRLCIRVGSQKGPQYTGAWRSAHESVEPKRCAVFFVRDKLDRGDPSSDRETYVLIASSEQAARDYAIARQRKRLVKYAGLAKQLLGVAMHQVSEGQGAANASNAHIGNVINRAASVTKSVSGYNSGKSSIVVQDLLRYAIPAINGGAATINLAIKKAANTTAARISKLSSLPFSDQLPTPFPEITS